MDITALPLWNTWPFPASALYVALDAPFVYTIEPVVVEDLPPAVQWVVQSKALFRGHVTMPKYLSLNKEDQQRVLRDMSEEEDTGTRDFFLFFFQFAEDMELFLKACADKQGLRVNAMFDI